MPDDWKLNGNLRQNSNDLNATPISGAKLNFRYSKKKKAPTTKFEEWAKISYNFTTMHVNGYMSFSNSDTSDIYPQGKDTHQVPKY